MVEGSPEAAAQWALVERIGASKKFRRARKLRAFLFYICEKTLLGKADHIREQEIGHRVFGREEDYSASEDNIVRVEARELRKRLEEYFSDEGAGEPTIISIPKGGYVPHFEERPARTVGPVEKSDGIPAGVEVPGWRRLFWPGLCFTLLIALVLVAARDHRAKPELLETGESARYAVYSDLMGAPEDGRETLLVIGNPKVLLYYGSNNPTVANPMAAEPILSVPPEFAPELQAALNLGDEAFPYRHLKVTVGAYAGVGTALAAYHIGRLMQLLGREVQCVQGRNLTWESVQGKDLILLDAPNVNDWTYRHMPRTNFSFTPDGVNNTSPLPGEERTYWIDSQVDYGVISMVKLDNGSRVLSLTGRSTGAASGVAEYFTNPQRMAEVGARILEATDGGEFPDTWELLVRTLVRDRLPLSVSLVSLRAGSPGA